MEYCLKKLSENKWFKTFENIDDLDFETFIDSLCSKCKLTILLQSGCNNSIGIYAIVKGKGLYGFTTLKNNFFSKYGNVELTQTHNGIQTFVLNDKQNVGDFIEILDKVLNENNIEIKTTIDICYYESELDNILKL